MRKFESDLAKSEEVIAKKRGLTGSEIHSRTLLRVSVDGPPRFLALAGIRTGALPNHKGGARTLSVFLLGYITDLHDSRSYWIFKIKT